MLNSKARLADNILRVVAAVACIAAIFLTCMLLVQGFWIIAGVNVLGIVGLGAIAITKV